MVQSLDHWDSTFAPFAENIQRRYRDINKLKLLFKELSPHIADRADGVAVALNQPDWRSADPRNVLDTMAARIQEARPTRFLVEESSIPNDYELTPSWAGVAVDVALVVGEIVRAAWPDNVSEVYLFTESPYKGVRASSFGCYGQPVVSVEPPAPDESGIMAEIVLGVAHQFMLCAAQGVIPRLAGQVGVETRWKLWGEDPTGQYSNGES